MKKSKKILSFPTIFTTSLEGGYTATVPSLPGCISEGDSFEEAKKNITEAIELYLSIKKGVVGDQNDFVVSPVNILV